MFYICPKHKTQLPVNSIVISLLGSDHFVKSAKCKDCGVTYINRRIFKSSDDFKVKPENYLYWADFENKFPYTKSEEERFYKEKKEKELKTKLANEEKLRREQELKNMKAGYENNPSLLFIAKATEDVLAPAQKCPHCGDRTIFLNRVSLNKQPETYSGVVCVRCRIAFNPIQKKKVAEEQPARRSKKGKKKLQCASNPVYLGERKNPDTLKQDVSRPSPDFQTYSKIFNLPKTPPLQLPKSCICVVKVGDGYLSIVSNASDQNTLDGAYFIERSLASAAFIAIMRGNYSIEYDKKRYKVELVTKGPAFTENKKHYDYFWGSKSVKTIYVYRGKRPLEPDVVVVTAFVQFTKNFCTIPVSVYYSPSKKLYYINRRTLELHTKSHGLPLVKTADYEPFSADDMDLNQNSKLRSLGYSVSYEKGLSDSERKQLLAKIIDKKLMKKHEIMSHLEFLISIHKSDIAWQFSVRRWSEDLKFVSSYKMETQAMIWGQLKTK